MPRSHKSRLLVPAMLVVMSIILFNHSVLFTKENPANTPVFTGNEDHQITLAEASELTFNFRMQAGPGAITGGFFGKEAVLAILAQEGAVGLRYYYGVDAQGKRHIILIGVDRNGNDMTDGLLAQRSVVCPPACARDNELNSPSPQTQVSSVLK